MVQQTTLEGMAEIAPRGALQIRPQDELELISLALSNGAAIDVIERLTALREKALAQRAELEFNEALNRVQSAIKRIAPDLENPSKKSKYASYAAIDRVVRPIYAPEGFSLSFTHDDSPKPDHVRVVALLSLRSHTRRYQMDMPVDTQGPNGNAVMTRTHATAAADSYAKRYLVKDIFNIAIGDEDIDGNDVTTADVAEQCEWLENAKDLGELKRLFDNAYKKYASSPNAQKILVAAKDRRKAQLQ